jgi:hypothetical protein
MEDSFDENTFGDLGRGGSEGEEELEVWGSEDEREMRDEVRREVAARLEARRARRQARSESRHN